MNVTEFVRNILLKYDRLVRHCHVPLVSGRTATIDTVGGVVSGAVDHPTDEEGDLYIEFVGIVLDSHGESEKYEQLTKLIDMYEKMLEHDVEKILNNEN